MKEKDSVSSQDTTDGPVLQDVRGSTFSQSSSPGPSLPSTDLETDGSEASSHLSLIREEQAENELLRNDNNRLKEHLRILSNRLSNLGQPVHCAVGENELLIPETSRELVDNLVRENIRLKREIHRGQSSAPNPEMENTKDLMIAGLREELGESKEQIKELAEQCRQLVLQQDEMKTRSISDNIEKISLDNRNEEVTQLRKQNNILRSEALHLKKQLQEVAQSNARWKEYDRQREEHVDRINQELSQLNDRHHFEVQRLSEQNRSLENQVRQLKQAITHLEGQRSSGGMSQEQSDRMHALEGQVQEFSEAFQQERRDREKAQAKLSDLEETNYILKAQLEQFQTTQMNYLAERRTEAMRRHRMEYEQRMAGPYGINQRSILSHGPSNFVVADGDDEDEDIEDEDTVDLPMSHGVNSSSGAGQNSLDCPKCKKKFPVSDPMQFLEHNDQCQGSA